MQPATVPRPTDASGERREPSSKKHRILVVDDIVDAADSLAALLQEMGSDVIVAYDGPRALEAADHHRPDVILLDIGMPGMNGYEVCREIRRRDWGRSPCIVATTGWGQEEDRRRTREAGFDVHMVKPIDCNVLLDLIGRRAR